MIPPPIIKRGYAVLNPFGHPVLTCSHRGIAERNASIMPGSTVAVEIVTTTYEPVPAEIKLRRVS